MRTSSTGRFPWGFVALGLAACGGAPAVTTVPAPPPAPAPVTPVTPEKPMPPADPILHVTQTAAPQELVFPEEAFRAHQPVAGAPRPFRLLPVKSFSLPSGIKVYLVEQHALPLVSMDLSFDGGSAVDPKGKEGLASVCMAMLTEGTEQLDKIAYAERLADTASSIGAYASDDSVGVTLSSLSKHLDPTFAQFVDTIRTPGFRPSDFDRMVKRRIEGIKQAKGSPASVASRVSGAVLYGPDHPFGAVVTERALAALTLDDCKAFAHAWLSPKQARLFVVGDLTEARLRSYFGAPGLAGWKGGDAKLPALPAPRTMPGRIFFVDIPGATQSTVSYLQFGPKRTAPDYFASSLMGAVFGGGFASRINMNLREDKGYSYGARGNFSYTKSYGAFMASAPVVGNSTYQSLLEIDREIKGIWAGKPDFAIKPDELEREKNGAILGLPGRFATANAALGQYRGLVYFGLPLDYYASYVGKLGKVSSAEVMAAAAKHLRPGQAVYVIVGNGEEKMIVHVPDDKEG
ncbi:MAG TPA: pitrilysin family protein, partial [Solirubrobacterales bacterium]|nr:pitrilysin family protein [Solirubrobacterales bacterium]